MFVRIIPESSPIGLSNGYSDIPLPVASVELFPLVVEPLTPLEKDLKLLGLQFGRHYQNRYITPESALGPQQVYNS